MSQIKMPGSQHQTTPSSPPPSNLAEAMLRAGGKVAQSIGQGGVQITTNALDSMFGNHSVPFQQPQQQQFDQSPFRPPMDMFRNSSEFNPFNEQSEQEYRKREQRMLRHREIQQTEVFNLRKVETDRKIDQILQELHALVKDMDNAYIEVKHAQTAVIQGVVNGGEGHLSFLEKLLKTIIMLRKNIQESTTWLAQFNSKKSAQKGYWGQFHSQGTQWAMSQERALATSVG